MAMGGAALLGVGALIGAGVHQVLSEMEKEEQAEIEALQRRRQRASEEHAQKEASQRRRQRAREEQAQRDLAQQKRAGG